MEALKPPPIRGRAVSDLPSILQEWVDVDPKWRLVKLEPRPDRGCHLLTIIHVLDTPEFFHAAEVEVLNPVDPEEMREAILDVLDIFGKSETTTDNEMSELDMTYGIARPPTADKGAK